MNVQLSDEQSVPVEPDPLVSLAELAMDREGLPADAEMSLILVSDEDIAEYNERFLGRSGPTDVLAFPLESLSPGSPPAGRSNGGPPFNLGDVLVAPGYVERQARRLGVAFSDELSLMVVHGTLHLMGYDHEEDDDASAMEERERVLLAEIGVARR